MGALSRLWTAALVCGLVLLPGCSTARVSWRMRRLLSAWRLTKSSTKRWLTGRSSSISALTASSAARSASRVSPSGSSTSQATALWSPRCARQGAPAVRLRQAAD